MRITTSAALAALLLASLACASDAPAVHTDRSACMDGPISQFGRYVGDWKITDESFKQDGSGWEPGKGARWIFECVGPGLAIQDYWMPSSGGFGTNLRTFNPDTGSWEIIWTASSLNGLSHISAVQDDAGNIVMSIEKPVPDPPRRIIFYPPDADGWNWAMQWSLDAGASWFDVYRIRATRWQD